VCGFVPGFACVTPYVLTLTHGAGTTQPWPVNKGPRALSTPLDSAPLRCPSAPGQLHPAATPGCARSFVGENRPQLLDSRRLLRATIARSVNVTFKACPLRRGSGRMASIARRPWLRQCVTGPVPVRQ